MNMYCKDHKTYTRQGLDNYDATFRGKNPKDFEDKYGFWGKKKDLQPLHVGNLVWDGDLEPIG